MNLHAALTILLSIAPAVSSIPNNRNNDTRTAPRKSPRYSKFECGHLYEEQPWYQISQQIQHYCRHKGWTQNKWEKNWGWDVLTKDRQLFWSSKGQTPLKWEQDVYYWDELPSERRQYWISHGQSQESWEKDQIWEDLPPDRQELWIADGKTQEDWEKGACLWEDLSNERKDYYATRGWNVLEWEKEWDWDEFPDHRRIHYEGLGWSSEAWDKDDKSLINFYNEEEMEWDELTEERTEYWISRGWTEQKWQDQNNEQLEETPDKISDTEFKPMVIPFKIPELEELDMDYLSNLDTSVGLKDGTTVGDNESFHGSEMSLKEYMELMRNDNTTLYFQLEDLDHYKETFKAILGHKIIRYLYKALDKSALRESGHFKPEWTFNNPKWNPDEGFDWSLFVGSTGTTTSMHYDSDFFNFLYVVEGRKRIVMIPNDERTRGTYKLSSSFSGSAWTGEDILSRDYDLPEYAVELEIGAGQGIMFPYLCWHAVENLEPTIAYGLRVTDDYVGI